MWDLFKNPKKQALIVVLLVGSYWSWEFLHKDHSEYEEMVVAEEMVITKPDSLHVEPDSLSERQREEHQSHQDTLDKYFPELTYSFIEIPEDDNSQIIQTMELRIQLWDMILGHLTSILGSFAALLTPFITVYLNKKGYLNPSENVEK